MSGNNQMVFDKNIDTGKKWVDGTIIHRRLVNFGALPNAADKQINIGVAIHKYAAVTKFIVKQEEDPEAVFLNGMLIAEITAQDIQNNGDMTVTTDADLSALIAYIEIEFCINPNP